MARLSEIATLQAVIGDLNVDSLRLHAILNNHSTEGVPTAVYDAVRAERDEALVKYQRLFDDGYSDEVAEVHRERTEIADRWLRAEATLAAIRAWAESDTLPDNLYGNEPSETAYVIGRCRGKVLALLDAEPKDTP